jgi:hypothetical protein
MARHDSNQLTLSLFDSTAHSSSLTLDGAVFGFSLERAAEDDSDGDEARTTPAAATAIRAKDFRLRGDRALASSWTQRAIDNVAAIRLALEIEAAKRNATEDEQEALSRFVAFGGRDLPEKMFRRAGETFAPG